MMGQSKELHIFVEISSTKKSMTNPEIEYYAKFFYMPRLTKEGAKYGFTGKAFDIKNVWDLTIKQDQESFWKDFKKAKPDVLVLTVPCDQWSTMQNMSSKKIDPEVKIKRMSKAMKMLRFAVKLADEQFKAGRHIIIEQPIGSRMWGEKCMRQLFIRFACYEFRFDQCELGLKFMYQAREMRTRIVTSISNLAMALNAKQCNGKHTHRVIWGNANA